MDAWKLLKRKAWPMLLVVLVLMLLSQIAGAVRSAGTQPREGACVVMLDAGHGGADPGATSGIAVEKDLNLAIALKLQQYLEEAGYRVVMTRVIDEGLYGPEDENKKRADMAERKRLMEESGADLLVSIHQNSFPDPQYWGPQVFYRKDNGEGQSLAACIQKQLNEFTAPDNTRVIKPNDTYYILQNAPMPAAVLVECGFITNSRESESLSSPEYQRKVAWGIYAGIEEYLGGGPTP